MKKISSSTEFVHEDGLYVNWHLLDGSNHDCEYSHEPESARHERFSRESVLETAYRLLSLNRPEYIFHLYGGEPTIHPYFYDLVKYISTSGRNIRMVMDTNGLLSLEYYQKLLKSIPNGRLCVHIQVHCKYMDLEELLLLVAHVVESGQYCQVTLNHVPDYVDKAQTLAEKLLAFRNTVPFQMDVHFPMGGTAEWLNSVQQSFVDIQEPALEMPEWAILGQKEAAVQLVFDEDFVCVGTNGVQVAPDGVLTLGLCENDQPFVPQVMEQVCLHDTFPPVPSFPTAVEAEDWLTAFRIRALRYELDGGPVRHPLHTDMDEDQQLRVRLKRLKAESSYRRKRVPQPELWQERRADVLAAFSCFTDEDSRSVFLRCLKSQLVGDSGYLVRSDYAQFEHPRLSAGLSTDDPSCRLLRLNEVSQENVSTLLPRIQWYQPALEFVLPQTAHWLDIILELRAALPEYLLFLGQHGMQTVLYGAPSTQPKRYLPVPPRRMDGQPLVSVILIASDNADAVTRSIESVLAQDLPHYEVIVVEDGEASGVGETVDAFVRREPWRVRPFRLNESLHFSAACDAGLDMAQGEYVCFLHCGDTLKDGVLASAVKTLEAEQADVAITSPSATRNWSLEGSAILTRFLIGQMGEAGTRDKVYRSSLIREHAVFFADTPGQIEDDLFNLPLFHFARKAVGCVGELSSRNDVVEASSEEIFKTFLANLHTVARFCAAHDLNADRPELSAYVLRRFKEVKPDFLHVVEEAKRADRLAEVLDEATLRLLTPTVIQAICEEFSTAYCKQNVLSVELLPEPAPVDWHFYEGASAAFESEYPLSIVVTVEEGASLLCLEHLVQEDCGLVECVVIDNKTSEETAIALEAYADMYPNIRLIHMAKKALPAQCRNVGLQEARGTAVTFMESGDEPTPDFVASTTDTLQSGTEDVLVFGVQRLQSDGVMDFPYCNSDVHTGKDVVVFFLEKNIKFEPVGMVFRKAALLEKGVIFNPLVPEWDAVFVLRALEHATVRTLSETCCIRQEEKPQSGVVAYPGSLEAGCAFYALLQSLTEETHNEQTLPDLNEWVAESMKQTWLPLCSVLLGGGQCEKAFSKETGFVSSLLFRTVLGEYTHFESSKN